MLLGEINVPDFWRNKTHSPDVAGIGGEHVIYNTPGNKSLVLKIDALVARGFLNGSLTREDIALQVSKKNERQGVLVRSFGESHVLPTLFTTTEVILSADECRALAPTRPVAENDVTVPTIAVYQSVSPEIEAGSPMSERITTSLGDGKYAEERVGPEDFSTYERVSNALVLGVGLKDLHYQPPGRWEPSTWRPLWFNWSQPAIVDLAKGFINFREETRQNGGGEALDLIGTNNIVIFNKTAKHPETDFVIVDALYPYPVLTMDEISAQMLRLNVEDVSKFTRSDRLQIMNGVNYLRTANAVIDHCWSDIDIYNPFPEGTVWQPDIWQKVYTVSRQVLSQNGRINADPKAS